MSQLPAPPTSTSSAQKLKADAKLVVAEEPPADRRRKGQHCGPCTEAHSKELEQIKRSLAGVTIEAYAAAYNKGPVANDAAKKLLDDTMAIDDAEAPVKKATAAKAQWPSSPAMNAARYIQIENKIRAIIRYKLAAVLPLITRCTD